MPDQGEGGERGMGKLLQWGGQYDSKAYVIMTTATTNISIVINIVISL